jgi:L-aspartate oxidase
MSAAHHRTNVVIVGSGVAGLVTAIALHREHDVTIVTKSTISESNTMYAQGGIAAAVMPDDTVESHIADTLVAGAGLSDPDAVRVLCAEGPARIRDLIRFGVEFDRLRGGAFDAGLEGAHSHNRILHAGGDATGAEVERALVDTVHASGIRVVEHAFVLDLVVDAGVATGVSILRDGVVSTVAADAVVLASGGIGQMFPYTTNPSVTTGDGAAAALRAGAVLADAEFVQFHPTALAVPGSFLVSEAVRGDGAVLLNAAGERFMTGVHPLAELAPRDIVARAIAAEMAATGAAVMLDATALGADELERRFPTITAASRAQGFDWSRDPIPVSPAAHYWMGGVATDLDARTSLPGLFAVGEVSCTGVHGANRLASNSLLESLVFAHRATEAIEADARAGVGVREWVGLPNLRPLPEADLAASGAPLAAASPTPVSPASSAAASLAAGRESTRERGAAEPTRDALHALMWAHAGVYRNADGLAAARETLGAWSIDVSEPESVAVERLETANLLDVARILVEGASAREESRGAHFRSDFPEQRADFAHHQSITRKAELVC